MSRRFVKGSVFWADFFLCLLNEYYEEEVLPEMTFNLFHIRTSFHTSCLAMGLQCETKAWESCHKVVFSSHKIYIPLIIRFCRIFIPQITLNH